MRSLTARLLLSALACFGAAGAAYSLFQLEAPAAERRGNLAAFDRTARSVMLSLQGARAAQFAYIAEGQGAAIWRPAVAAALAAAAGEMDGMRALSATSEARAMLIEGAARLRSFADVDARALEYLDAGATLMASDLVFTEGATAIAAAIELVDSAWRREVEALADLEAQGRVRATYTAAGAGVGLVLALLLMALVPGRPAGPSGAVLVQGEPSDALDLHLRETGTPLLAPGGAPPEGRAPEPAPTAAPLEPATPTGVGYRAGLPLEAKLAAAAEVCVGLCTVTDGGGLRDLLARAASLMDASGVIVWVADANRAALRPVIAHGYAAHALSRIPAIATSADNAVAAAYRSASLQIVGASPGASGAVIAPLASASGCTGALSAEVPAGVENGGPVRAFALLFAAQLSAILAASEPDVADAASDARAASA